MIITINRGAKEDAFKKMYAFISVAFERTLRDETLHCILIKASGDPFYANNGIAFFLVHPQSRKEVPPQRICEYAGY